MANASIQDKGNGKYTIHWSEKRPDGKLSRKERPVYGTKVDAEQARLDVIAALEAHGMVVSRGRIGPKPPANILQGLLDYVSAKEGTKDLGEYSAGRHEKRAQHVVEAIHTVTRTPEDQPLPATLLGRDLFVKLTPVLTRERGDVSTRHLLSLLWRAWGWMADDLDKYPHVPPCLRSHSGLVPKGKKYGRTTAPTMAHGDACLRHLRRIQGDKRQLTTGSEIVIIAMFARFLGLRVGTVMEIEAEHLDIANGIANVKGKTEQEKEDFRPVPLSRHLLHDPLFVEWNKTRPRSGRVFKRVSHTATIVHAAWQAATDAGEVPRHVWAPTNRELARPDHAFRAAFQARGRDEKIDTDVVNYIVGHVGKSVQETFYGRDLMTVTRACVDGLPPIDWTGPQAEGSNVVQFVSAS